MGPGPVIVQQLQLVGSADTNKLLHTIRFPDGKWQGFGDVKAQIGDPGTVTAVATADVAPNFHLVGSTDTGFVFHTIRFTAGNWQAFGDVKGQIGDPGHVTAVAAAGLGADLHLVMATSTGGLYHTIRFGNTGGWQKFGDVKGQIGDPGHIKAIAAAEVGGNLHVVMTNDNGGLFHTIRFTPAGNWQKYGDVKGQIGNPGFISAVGAAGVNGDLQLAMATQSGGLFHTIRFSSTGNWQGVGDVKGQIGDPGFVTSVGAGSVQGDFQLAMTTQSGGLFHTIRFSNNGSWQKYGDVQSQAGGGHHFSVTGASGV